MTDKEQSKRKLVEDEDEALNGSAQKKPRIDEAPKKPGVDMSVLEKAKLALAKQKELKEKLAKIQAAKAAAPSAAGPSKPQTKLPPPLILDDQGREVGADGVAPPPTAPPPKKQLDLSAPPEEEVVDDRFFDPSIGTRGLHRMNRRARPDIRFVEEGRYQKQAEIGRLKAKFGDKYVHDLADRRKQEDAMAADNVDVNAIPLGTRAPAEPVEEPIPDVEWWDAKILVDKASYGDVKKERITHLVEHPVQLDPILEAPPPPPQPLKLTKKEMKKLRTQRRLAREQEKQDLIRQGLLEPPKPKVKLSNLMRVLGSEAAADPTAIEREVQRQMAERLAAHQDRNLANMLTPAERRDKKLRKILGTTDGNNETHVGVYKVKDLSKPQLRFKVEVNAKENHMTGLLILSNDFCLVVVEGSAKTLRRYEKLMMERIQWNKQDDTIPEDDEMDTDTKTENYCHLVWHGVVKEAAFRKFRAETVLTAASGKKLLADAGVEHYWDMAEAHQPAE